MKVLFLGANPAASTRLRLDREFREIDLHLNENAGGKGMELIGAWAVRITDLSRELLRHQPDIVHFGGHGESGGSERELGHDDRGWPLGRAEATGGLVFDTDADEGSVAPIGPLGDLFGLVASEHPIQAVILNACYSAGQADAIARHVELVVGTTTAVTDPGAIAFASGFYRGVAFGMQLRKAVDLGRTEVRLRGLPDAEIIVTARPGAAR